MSKAPYKKIDLNTVLSGLSPETRQEIHSIGDHKLFCGILDAHTEIMSELIDERLEAFSTNSWKELMDFIAEQYKGIGGQLATQTAMIQQVAACVNTLSADVCEVKEKVTKIEGKLINQESRLTNQEGRIKKLEGKVAEICDEVTKMKKEIDALKQ
jgi:chromosome segregation ATPase